MMMMNNDDFRNRNLTFISKIVFRTPPNCLTPNCRYEKMAEMAGGQGFFCETIDELKSALKKAVEV
jgi:thiamine pyrophosphate-dependent acetolactate synthase large subunit-like protein